jgi:hypothetical protein
LNTKPCEVVFTDHPHEPKQQTVGREFGAITLKAPSAIGCFHVAPQEPHLQEAQAHDELQDDFKSIHVCRAAFHLPFEGLLADERSGS